MLSIYVGCVLFGGVLLGASALGGHDHDASGGDGGGGDGHGATGPHASPFAFLSVRFWAFSVAFFGLAGLAFSLAGVGSAAVLAGVVGLGSGYAGTRVLNALTRKPVGLLKDANAQIGREGTLLLPVARGQRGKLRLSLGGISTDLLADTDADQPLAAGEVVLIVGFRDGAALVERSPAALPSVPRPSLSKKEES